MSELGRRAPAKTPPAEASAAKRKAQIEDTPDQGQYVPLLSSAPATREAYDDAMRAYYGVRWHDGLSPAEAAQSPEVGAALERLYAPCDEDAPLDSEAFANYVKATIHRARLAVQPGGIDPSWISWNDAQQRLLSKSGSTKDKAPVTWPNDGPVPIATEPDADLWAAATLNVPEIGLAASRRLGLQSPSEHDLSLANRLLRLDWTEQQVVDLLQWNRMRRDEDLKYPGYYSRTVAVARKTVEAMGRDR